MSNLEVVNLNGTNKWAKKQKKFEFSERENLISLTQSLKKELPIGGLHKTPHQMEEDYRLIVW